MYWLAGLKSNGSGQLFTFEINEQWRQIAIKNLSGISDRFTSINGPFEDKADEALQGRKIDLAFIDAIHTSEWVLPQLKMCCGKRTPGASLFSTISTFPRT